MNHAAILAAVTVALASCASMEPARGGGPPDDAAQASAFAARTRRAADQIETEVGSAVRRGREPEPAMREIRHERARLEQVIAQSEADGEITRDERDEVDATLDAMRAVADRYRDAGWESE